MDQDELPQLRRQRPSLAPRRVDISIATGAVLLLVALLAALARGRDACTLSPAPVRLHLGTVALALALTVALMSRRRSDRWHRIPGWAWAATMVLTALISLEIRFNRPGQPNPIHLLTALTLVLVPRIVYAARSHRVLQHRFLARFTVILALLIAGALTFGFQRLLGRWLLG